MKKIFKTLFCLTFGFIFMFSNILNVNAATATIKVTSGTSKVVIGNTFSVTVTVGPSSTVGGWDYKISYDTKKLKLVSGDTHVVGVKGNNSLSVTYKFKAIGTGTSKISVSAPLVYDYKNEAKMSVSTTSKTVTVITQAQLEASYSKDNYLKSLSVDGFKLSPTFNKDVTEYRIEAGANTTSVKINASKNDSRASVSGTGVHEVSEGENKFNVIVTAENGKTKTYTVIVNVKDPNPINIKIDDKDLVVVKREKNLEAPEGFTKTKVTISEQEVPGFYNEVNKFTLVGLKDDEGNIKLYIYDKENDSYSEYQESKLEEMKLYPLTIDKAFDDIYNKEIIEIDGVKFEALKIKNSLYSIIHAKDLNTGESNYYKYDSKTNTIIRYTDEDTKPLEEKLDEYEKITKLLAVETVFVIFILICLLIGRIRRNSKRKKMLKKQLKEAQMKEELESIKKVSKKKDDIKEKIDEIEEEIKELQDNDKPKIEEIKEVKSKGKKRKKN